MGFKTKAEAEAAARKALSLLADDGFRVGEWESEVWENLGWHAKLWCGPISVYYSTYASDGKLYSCMIAGNVNESHHGCCDWHNTEAFTTPGEAIRHEVAMMRAYAERERKRLADLEAFVSKVLDEGK